MSRRHFSILFVIAIIVAAAIVLLVPRELEQDGTESGEVLLETVAEQINDVDRLVISGAGGQPVSTLLRGDKQWTISELQGYPADWDKLRAVLEDLARARVLETKTSNPEYYARLGVEDTGDESAGGLLLEVASPGHSVRLIAGDDARDLGGQFVRLADQPQSVLIDRRLDLSATPVEWADREIVDISPGSVAEVEIRHPDGDRILASKVSADDPDFSLGNMPPGRELVSSWTLNSLASAFSGLRLDEVKPEPEDLDTDPVVFRILTFQGLEVIAETTQMDDRKWIRLITNAPAGEENDTKAAPGTATDPVEQAEEINTAARGWLFSVSESKSDVLTKRLEQLLKPEENPDGGGS